MRRSPHALARSCIVLVAAVGTVVPAGAATAATPVAPKTPQSHVVGGFLPSAARVAPATTRAGARASEVLPASVDLRQYAPTPGNQGQVGSCVAWTIGYGIMGYYANRTGGAGAPYAPLFLYLRNVAPGGAPSAGLYPDAVLANAQSAGVDTQADYWQGTTDYRTAPTAAQIANAANYRIAGWKSLFNGAGQGDPVKASIKQALAGGSPVALGIPVYQDFMYLRSHALYNTLSGASLGGHMIAAFGYDDTGVLIRNSWGTGWGNGGDAKLSWAFITRIAMSAYSVSGIRTPADAPVPAAPTVASVVPATGYVNVNTPVVVTGTGLATVTKVTAGDRAVAFTKVNDTTLKVTLPPHAAGDVALSVTTANGTSPATTAGRFTYRALPVPSITAVTPPSGVTYAATNVVVTGTALGGATQVTVDGRPAAFAKISDTSLRVTVPAHPAGAVVLRVVAPGGTSGDGGRFSHVAPPVPVVSVVAPSSGTGRVSSTVLLSGADLRSTSRVTAGDLALSFVVLNDQQVRVTLAPRPAGQVALRVTTAGGVSAPATYLVNPSVATVRGLASPLPVLFAAAGRS